MGMVETAYWLHTFFKLDNYGPKKYQKVLQIISSSPYAIFHNLYNTQAFLIDCNKMLPNTWEPWAMRNEVRNALNDSIWGCLCWQI